MIWKFSRGREQVRIENRYDKASGEFLLLIDHPNGHRETKRFADARAFRTWLSAFEEQLEARQWVRSSPAVAGTDWLFEAPRGAGGVDGRQVPQVAASTTRLYTSGARTFELLLSHRMVRGAAVWAVERVLEMKGEIRPTLKRVAIPRMQGTTAASDDEAFALACDRIDAFVRARRRADRNRDNS